MKLSDNPIIFLFKKVWQYSHGNRKKLTVGYTLLVLSNISGFFEPLVVALLLNTIQLEGVTSANVTKIIWITALFIGLTLFFWLFHGPGRVIEEENAFLLRANFKKYMLDGTMRLPLQWHVDHHSGDTYDKVNSASKSLEDFGSNIFQVVQIIIKLVSSIIVLAYFNLNSAFIVLLLLIIGLMIMFAFNKRLRKRYIYLHKLENNVSAKIFDVITNITTVIILRLESLLSREIMKKMLKPHLYFVKTRIIEEGKWALVSLFTAFMKFGSLSIYIYTSYTAGTTILLGTLYALYGYVDKITDVFFHLAWQYGQFVYQKASLDNSEKISKEFREKNERDKVSLDKSWRNIHIDHLTFSYHKKKEGRLDLNGISFDFNKNENIALIGESGSGKTTFLKLIRGLYTPKEISLSIDGKKIHGGFESIQESITLIPQEPEIFQSTMRHNITVGVPRSDEDIKKVSDMAEFTKVYQRLPKKLSSSIVEKGVNLSGGEKQRLALARGLLASMDKAIVLLDEPTSSVDYHTEMTIYQNILKSFRGKVIISSIHRLHLLTLFDKIYMFKDGKIIAGGSFDQLLKESKEFNKVWSRYKLKSRK